MEDGHPAHNREVVACKFCGSPAHFVVCPKKGFDEKSDTKVCAWCAYNLRTCLDGEDWLFFASFQPVKQADTVRAVEFVRELLLGMHDANAD